MNTQRPQQEPPNIPVAGRMFDVVRKLQKNRERFSGMRRPSPLAQKVPGGDEVMSALYQKQKDEQK